MLTNKSFSTTLTRITKTGEALDALIVKALEFAVFHAVAHDNYEPFERLGAVIPAYAVRTVGKAYSASKKLAQPKPLAAETASTMAFEAGAEMAERRVVTAEKRALQAEKAEKAKAEKAKAEAEKAKAEEERAKALAKAEAEAEKAKADAKKAKERAKAAEAKAEQAEAKAAGAEPVTAKPAQAQLVSKDGHAQDLSEEEYAALSAYLTELRTKDKVKVA